MADSDKNILITPNTGSTTDSPKIEFTGGDNNTVTLTTLDDGTLSFSGTSGQLFSISDSLTGTIFSVNDVSGIPSIEVDDDGTVRLAEFGGNLLIGTDVDTNSHKMQLVSSVSQHPLYIESAFSDKIKLKSTNTSVSGNGIDFYNSDDKMTGSVRTSWSSSFKYTELYQNFDTSADQVRRLRLKPGEHPKAVYGSTEHNIFNDSYHPNADKLTLARSIALSGAVTGSASFDGSANITISTTATADPTLTLTGDATGSATFTNLGNATLTVAVANDSHSHSNYLPNSGTVTHSGLVSFNGTGATSGIRFNSATVANDAFGIRANGTSNAGELEFYSTDDDNEPFVFRHYTTGQDGTGSNVEWARISNLGLGIRGSTIVESNKNINFVRGSSGTLASRTGFNDFIGYNPSYGSYIGGGVSNASNYIYAGGYISKGGIHTLWHSGNDGSGSGLDADTLDGQQPSQLSVNYANSAGNADTLDGQHGSYYDQRVYTSTSNYLGGHYVSGGSEKPNSSALGKGKLKPIMLSGSNIGVSGAWNDVLWMSTYTGTDVKLSTAIISSKYDNTSVWVNKANYDSASWGTSYLFWNSGNDGSGSGLDADTVDGKHASEFANASHSHTLTLNGDVSGSGSVSGTITVTVNDNSHNHTSVPSISSTSPGSSYDNSLQYWQTSGQGTAYAPTTDWYNTIRGAHGNANTYYSNTLAMKMTGSYVGDIYTQTRSNGTLQGWNRFWHSNNDGSGSGLDADLLDGKDHTNFGATLATYGTTAGSSGRIRCTAPFNTNSAHMFQVTVSVYTSYTCHSYVVSGYMYPSTNQWHSPKVIYTGTGTPDIVLGRDNNGKAYISIANGAYTGVRVHNMTRGYQTSVADTYDPWTITIDGGTENSITPTISKVWHSTNDGSGSGLDADLLDGQHASAFASASHSHSNYLTTTGKAADSNLLDGIDSGSFLRSDTTDYLNGVMYVRADIRNETAYRDHGVYGHYDSTKTNHIWSMGSSYRNSASGSNFGNLYGLAYKHTNNPTGGDMGGGHQMVWCDNGTPRGAIGYNYVWHASGMRVGSNTVWHAGNDGSGSGLDADLLDGQHASAFAPASHSHSYLPLSGGTVTGNVTFSGSGNSARLTVGGSRMISVTGSGDVVWQNLGQLRLSDRATYDWNDWAGIKYSSANQQLYIGGPASSVFNSNSSPPNVVINFDGVSDIRHNGTTVIDSSRNLTNIASITTGRVNLSAGQFIKLSGATDSTHHIFHNASTDYDEISVSTGFKVSHHTIGDRLTLVGSTGALTVSGNVTAYSDITLKGNITEIDNALEKVNSIRGVTYDRIDQDNARHAGVIAQEVEEVLPEVVHTDDNGIKSVAYGNMVGLLIEAIKEQQTQINELQAQINTLKGE